MHGVILTQGPQNFQIIPRQKPELTLRGTLRGDYSASKNTVQARIVNEDTGVTVVDWTDAAIDGGGWTLTLGPIPIGGPYRLETQVVCTDTNGGWFTHRGDMIHHLGVGDLFLVTGQSNATGYGQEPVFDPPELGIAVFRENGRWDLASHPLSDGTGSFHSANLEDINPRHSPWLSFARIVRHQTKTPVGLIPVSLGGTNIDRWDTDVDGDCYKVMVEVHQKIGGPYTAMLWYQGCSDAVPGRADRYYDAFQKFVADSRRDLDDAALPVYTVQLNRDVYPFDENEGWDRAWATVREAQRRAARELDGVYVIPAHDLTLGDNIHNTSAANMTIGQRAAHCVLQHTFGYPVPGTAPDIETAKLTAEKQVTLTFSGVYGFLTARAAPPECCAMTVRDELGVVPLTAVAAWGGAVQLTLGRELAGKATVSAADSYNYNGVPPTDALSGMPLLAFFEFPVEFIS